MNNGNIKKLDLIFDLDYSIDTFLKSYINVEALDLLNVVNQSKLRGRGGAGFHTSKKWEIAKECISNNKYVICNADEGEPGTFKDREIIGRVANKVLAGMVICAKVIGSNYGIIYLRAEYYYLKNLLQKEIDKFQLILKTYNLNFEIEIFMGAGAYVCGEETALIESMEGKRGEPRNKPPYPVETGYKGSPTVINNVETFASIFVLFNIGAEKYKKLGTSSSRGSKLFSVSGDTPIPGVYELELGMTLSDFVDEFGDGDTNSVQVGGASGFCVPRKKFSDTIIGFEGIPTGGSMMLFNSSRSMYNVLVNYLDFFSEESCGQCTPCRVGCQQLLIGVKSIKSQQMPEDYLDKLIKLSRNMQVSSKCGLGRSVANSFCSISLNFREEIIY